MAVVRDNAWVRRLHSAYQLGRRAYRVYKYVEPHVRKAVKRNKGPYGGPVAFKPKPIGSNPRGPPTGQSSQAYVASRGKRRYGNGRAAGKLRKSRRSLKSASGYKLRSGVATTIEAGQVLAASEVQYIGHITHPQKTVLTNMWLALIKKLMFKTGVTFKSLRDALPVIATDAIQIQYQPEPGSTFTLVGYTLPVGSSVEDIAAVMMDPARPWYSNPASARMQDFQFIRIAFITPTFNPSMNPAYIDMESCRVHFDIKSSLKMQNRSVTTAEDNEADDVDNVPLYGKRYSGTGTGARLMTRPYGAQQFYGDTTYGLIKAQAALIDEGINEPPAPYLFQEVKKWSKISISPGDIKTSVISSKGSMKWNEMHVKLMYYFANVVNGVKRQIGKFEFLALEKLLDCTSIPESINVAIECEWTGQFQVSTPTPNPTMTSFVKAYLTD